MYSELGSRTFYPMGSPRFSSPRRVQGFDRPVAAQPVAARRVVSPTGEDPVEIARLKGVIQKKNKAIAFHMDQTKRWRAGALQKNETIKKLKVQLKKCRGR